MTDSQKKMDAIIDMYFAFFKVRYMIEQKRPKPDIDLAEAQLKNTVNNNMQNFEISFIENNKKYILEFILKQEPEYLANLATEGLVIIPPAIPYQHKKYICGYWEGLKQDLAKSHGMNLPSLS